MRAFAAWLGGTAILAALALTLDGYAADLFRKLLLVATLCVGFNFLFGIAGQLAISHIAFYGIGAYGVVVLAFQFGWPLPLAIIGSIVICGIVALLVAIPATRLEGFFLALATLAFAQLFSVVLLQGGEKEERLSHGRSSFLGLEVCGRKRKVNIQKITFKS